MAVACFGNRRASLFLYGPRKTQWSSRYFQCPSEGSKYRLTHWVLKAAVCLSQSRTPTTPSPRSPSLPPNMGSYALGTRSSREEPFVPWSRNRCNVSARSSAETPSQRKHDSRTHHVTLIPGLYGCPSEPSLCQVPLWLRASRAVVTCLPQEDAK